MRTLIDIDPEQGDDEWQPPAETLVCLRCGLYIISNREPHYCENPCPICEIGIVDYEERLKRKEGD